MCVAYIRKTISSETRIVLTKFVFYVHRIEIVRQTHYQLILCLYVHRTVRVKKKKKCIQKIEVLGEQLFMCKRL